MNNIGKISIVLPCYKAERFVGDMIVDIQAQTYNDWELIIVSNGAGQEAQLKVIEGYAKADNRIHVISVEQGGVSNARNIGMGKATGTWLAFVDADDRCDSNHLELLAKGCIDDTDIVVGGYTQFWPKWGTSSYYKIKERNRLDEDFVMISNTIQYPLWNKLFNISKLQNWGG